ncbi:hypothetical protein FRC01_010617 [Tulasnella sp. 417]|nr:hypothetical protein FRC01_010617 [Tulasnella sp. 417]
MQENKDHAASPSRLSESDQGDTHSALLHSSKIREKLEKLSQWRINPSLVEFPEVTPEFRGGYATVSRGLLTSRSNVEEPPHEAGHITDERPDSGAPDLQPQSDTHEPDRDQPGRDDKAETRNMGGDNDHTKQEGRNENNDDEEQKSRSHTSIPKMADESTFSKNTADKTVGSDDQIPRSQGGVTFSDDGPQGQDKGMVSRLADGHEDQMKEKAKIEVENTSNDQNSDSQTSEQKVRESAPRPSECRY